MKQLNPKQKVFSKEDILKEIKARTDFGKEIIEIEYKYYMELLKEGNLIRMKHKIMCSCGKLAIKCKEASETIERLIQSRIKELADNHNKRKEQ